MRVRDARSAACAAVMLLAAAAACSRDPAPPASPAVRTPVPVGLLVVTAEDGAPSIRKTTVLASETDVDIAAESAGVVLERCVAEGVAVEAGSPLLRMDGEAEAAAVKAARARLAATAAPGAGAAGRAGAEAALAAAEAAFRRRTVSAPASGVLDAWLVEPGEAVIPGRTVARLVDPARLKAVATVLETEIAGVRTGAAVLLDAPALPGRRFPGRVARNGAAALPGSGLFEVEIAVDASPDLRPGFHATIEIPLAGGRRRLLVPGEAVFRRHGSDRVFVAVEGPGGLVAAERIVATASVPGRPEQVEVCSGLAAGDRVVVRGRLGLVAGDGLAPEAP